MLGEEQGDFWKWLHLLLITITLKCSDLDMLYLSVSVGQNPVRRSWVLWLRGSHRLQPKC